MKENNQNTITPPVPGSPAEQTQSVSPTPKSRFKFPILVFGVVLFLVLIGTVSAAYLFITKQNPKQTACTLEAKICPDGSSVGRTGPNCSFAPCPTAKISPAQPSTMPISNSANQIYTNDYGAYQFQYPRSWHEVGAYGGGGPTDFIYLGPIKNGATIITLQQSQTDISSARYNYNIPMISPSNNAYFTKDQNRENIAFKMHGLNYILFADLLEAQKQSLSADQVDSVLKNIVNTLNVSYAPSTCKSPKLVPLNNFPDNFTLSNYHDSDGTDSIPGSWPFATTQHYSQPAPSGETTRGFMVTYIKSGNSFEQTPDFTKTVVAINSVKTPAQGGFDQDGTDIWHINCIDTEEDGPGFTQPFHIGQDVNDQFAIHLYGNAANPNQLWGVEKWSISLLKSKRNEVYIKQGNMWQKYIARDFFATRPAAYGGKPAIYLYPTKKTSVKVEIHPRGNLLEADNLYDSSIDGWYVEADTNGSINDSLKYLYYEAAIPVNEPKAGYTIEYKDLFKFSRDYVLRLGLNNTEADEFVAFWQKKLPYSPFYFVSHLDLKTIQEIYPLKITPVPDNLLRVEIYFKPIGEFQKFDSPIYPAVSPRTGFTAVEWGGILDR